MRSLQFRICITVQSWTGPLSREEGQDLIEYSLLLAFVALAGAAMFISMGGLTSSLWSITNGRMASANAS